ncbi:MAG: 23S rRNA (pseudouridine(1915)-N(3))-methyltransferase RlmH [Xanthomonadales bacterium]|nr:23S rRNA (pseudouridine(1915)-N(3))-methyltransferase RlmH [Xanthomonadales bacterium]
MRLRIISMGARPADWVTQGFNDYARRMPRHLPLELLDINAPSRKRKTIDDCRAEEAELLLKAVGKHTQIIAMHEHGRTYRSKELAKRFSGWLNDGRDLAFVIGGPDGLAPDLLQRADSQWALGPMTLPHALVRIVVAEQLYRAWTLLEGHPYHRE